MPDRSPLDLSRRERQVMEIPCRLGEASVADVQEALPDPPTYSAMRAALRLLVEKGHARHRKDGRRCPYAPTMGAVRVRRSAVRSLLATSCEEEYLGLRRLIDDARQEGGGS